MVELGVNIDHVATLRQARYATMLESPNAEPCPLQAALEARDGGADSITMHVRGDRRHIQETDVFVIREGCSLPINLEMANTREMLALALRLKPEFVCLVPENRQEISTEGGLGVAAQLARLKPTVESLREAGIKVSLFIDPDPEQVEHFMRQRLDRMAQELHLDEDQRHALWSLHRDVGSEVFGRRRAMREARQGLQRSYFDPDADPEQVQNILLAVAKKEPLVSDFRDPAVRFVDYGDNSINFVLLF